MEKIPSFARVSGIENLTAPAYTSAAFGDFPAGDRQSVNLMRRGHQQLVKSWSSAWRQRERLLGDETQLPGARELAAAKMARNLRTSAVQEAGAALTAGLKRLGVVQSELEALASPPQHAGKAALHGELRAHLRSLEPAARNELLESGDMEILHAVAAAPAALSGTVETTRERLVGRFFDAMAPEAWQESQQLTAGCAALEGALQSVAEHFSESFDFDGLAAYEAGEVTAA
jgi:hypothetical protein